ncbi:hypothetical protein J4N46_09375 [Capnocytophaga sp. Marseille-Q4570]|uniref:Uncharacterized protein n=1 Tax=Capnocytophaga bilenii TaxID=2819369 RepID=A0ABS3Q0F5_9FLAO|nr:hypothetical protein [Capnocytophaga bilenii]MBO1884614.1 hypothetical protein [Capnocytophaga bilenii]
MLIFIGCSKDKNEPEAPSAATTQVETPEHLKDWTPQPKVDSKQPYMVFAAGSASATTSTTITLTATGSYRVRPL